MVYRAHMATDNLLEWALRYASLGWPVFPCWPGKKSPACKHGVLDATTDPRTIRYWWAQDSAYNVAIATGLPSGLAVVDLDCPASETPDVLRRGEWTIGLVSTPRGGEHWYFTAPAAGDVSAQAILPGVDLRINGGYVLAPPSVGPTGAYSWARIPCREEIQRWDAYPQAIRDLYLASRPAPLPPPTPRALRAPADAIHVRARASRYLAAMPAAISGQGGHKALYKCAIALIRGFDLPADEVLAMLWHEYNPRCVPAWTLRELEHKVADAQRGGGSRGYLIGELPRATWGDL